MTEGGGSHGSYSGVEEHAPLWQHLRIARFDALLIVQGELEAARLIRDPVRTLAAGEKTAPLHLRLPAVWPYRTPVCVNRVQLDVYVM